jgi:hypothetical protein
MPAVPGQPQQTQQQPQQTQQVMVQGPGLVTTLRRNFNPKTGRMEVVKNGIISNKGFLNFEGISTQNRRKHLRSYRLRRGR